MEQYRRLLTLLILHPTAHAAGKVQGDSSAPPSSTQYTLRRRIERAYDADPAINIAATMLPCGQVAQISKVSRRIARLSSLFLRLQFHILFFLSILTATTRILCKNALAAWLFLSR